MPDFNFRNPEVLHDHLSSMRFWLERGLDGFRLDAVPHLIENSAERWNDQFQSRRLTKQFQTLVKGYPNRYVVCEATANPQVWAQPQLCGQAFAFGLVNHCVAAAKGNVKSARKAASNFAVHPHTPATFVSNHAIMAGQRLWDRVDGDAARCKLTAAAYLLQPGTPFIHYGEQVDQSGLAGLAGHLPVRGPMSWAAEW